MRVIVTNAKNRIAYNVVRSLGQRGIEVYTADFVPRSMSFASRYSKGYFLYPSPFRDPEGFIACLISEIHRLQVDLLIPVFEETFLVAKHKERLSEHVKLVVPDYDQILLAHNKDRWEVAARELGIPVPRTYQISSLREGAADMNGICFPVLIKPKQGGGAWGIQQANTAEALKNLLATDDCGGRAWDRFFVQEKVVGESHCVAMLFNRGQLRAKVTYRQLRDYPVSGGQATLRVSVRNSAAEDHLRRLLESWGWHGVCQADFICDGDTGVPYLIDINPRLWGSLVQAIASGVDFPYLIYRIARDGDVAPENAFKTGVVTRWFGGEMAALVASVGQPARDSRGLWGYVFPGTQTVLYDDISLADPLPLLVWIGDALCRAVKHRSLRAVSHDSLDGVWE